MSNIIDQDRDELYGHKDELYQRMRTLTRRFCGEGWEAGDVIDALLRAAAAVRRDASRRIAGRPEEFYRCIEDARARLYGGENS
jgi:hypothetical protein